WCSVVCSSDLATHFEFGDRNYAFPGWACSGGGDNWLCCADDGVRHRKLQGKWVRRIFSARNWYIHATGRQYFKKTDHHSSADSCRSSPRPICDRVVKAGK